LARLAEDANGFSTGESPLDLEARADRILESVGPFQVGESAAAADEAFAPPGIEIAQLEVLDWTLEDQAHPQDTYADTDADADAHAGTGTGTDTDADADADADANANAGAESDADNYTDADADRSMEFTLPPGELDRIFVESKKRAPLPIPPSAQPPAPQSPPPVRPPPPAQQSPPPVQPPPPAQQSSPLAQPPPPAQQSPPLVQPPPPAQQSPPPVQPPPPAQQSPPLVRPTLVQPPAGSETRVELAPHPESAAANVRAVAERVTGLEVPEGVRRDMQAGFEQRREADLMQAVMEAELMVRPPAPRDARRQLILWLGGAVVSALLLMVQVVHQNREWFIAHAHGPFSAVVRALYGAMGAPIPLPANLSAYQLRQWGVTGDPDANGTLRVRASILNTAAQLQPYPLLRVTLADRFGKRIGTRDFEPTEYVGKPTARLLTPGERVDATLDILDPGKNAEGFEIDVCLRGVDKKISCANDVAPQTQR
jgi:Protein of unknown function (DUF3426)